MVVNDDGTTTGRPSSSNHNIKARFTIVVIPLYALHLIVVNQLLAYT